MRQAVANRWRGRSTRLIPAGLLALGLAVPGGGLAQAPDLSPDAGAEVSIADLRADLDILAGELQALRRMLKASGAQGYAGAGGADALVRMDRMEATLRRLTDRTETAGNRVEALAADMARRIDDLEFRLCELDAQCDLGALMSADGGGDSHRGPVNIDLGGGVAGSASPIWDGAASGLFDLPVSAAERSDFDAAQALSQAGDHAAAAFAFGEVAEDHAGGPLFAEARFREGQELLAIGDRRGASRAWTDVFAADPSGMRAPDALLGVARITAESGQVEPACLFLSEIMLRYGELPRMAEAAQLHADLDCDAVLALDPAEAEGLDGLMPPDAVPPDGTPIPGSN